MPLSEPAAREHIHTREVVCRGYRRADGLWDIEGHLTDTKTYAFNTEQRGRLEPGDPVHEMWVRLTVDDRLTVHAIEVVTDKSPYRTCGDITPAYQQLVGLSIAKGWTAAVKQRLGGVHGCTHLVELMGPVATTAFQTIYPVLAREAEERVKAGGKPPRGRPALLDMCHIFRSDGEAVRRNWPDHYTGEKADEAAD